MERWPKWSVSYNFECAEYEMQVVARDADEARRRLSAAATLGSVDGEIMAEIPAVRGGFLVPLVCWFRNALRRA